MGNQNSQPTNSSAIPRGIGWSYGGSIHNVRIQAWKVTNLSSNVTSDPAAHLFPPIAPTYASPDAQAIIHHNSAPQRPSDLRLSTQLNSRKGPRSRSYPRGISNNIAHQWSRHRQRCHCLGRIWQEYQGLLSSILYKRHGDRVGVCCSVHSSCSSLYRLTRTPHGRSIPCSGVHHEDQIVSAVTVGVCSVLVSMGANALSHHHDCRYHLLS